MTISLTPVEGKFIVLKAPSTEVYPWYREGGKITRISGQRVYYMGGAAKKELFTHDVAAVCDTTDEVDRLLEFSKVGQEAVAELLASLKAKDESLWATCSLVPKAAPKAAPRTRRKA